MSNPAPSAAVLRKTRRVDLLFGSMTRCSFEWNILSQIYGRTQELGAILLFLLLSAVSKFRFDRFSLLVMVSV